MKYILVPAIGVLLLAAVPAVADPPPDDQHRTQSHPAPQGHPPPGGSQMQGGPMMGGPSHGSPMAGQGNQTPPTYHRTERYSGPQGYTPGQRPANWNNRPRSFDPKVYHHNYTAAHRYHWRAYAPPPGWAYQRWTYGQYLPQAYWAQNYWINDFWDFGLDIPPYGYQWVQYGDDALLVSTDTGQVLEVVYDVFD
ncbi:MAG: RcnB family protein [Rhizomicrobium sp.]